MRKKILALATGVALLGAVGGLTLAAASTSGSPSGTRKNAWGISYFPGAKARSDSRIAPTITTGRKLVLISRGGTESDVDEPPGGESQGDEFTVNTPLYNQAGRRVGQLDVTGVETRVSRTQVRLMTLATASLKTGEIDAQGVGFFTPSTASFNIGVSGGTRQYQNVRGELHVRFPENQNVVILTYRLIP